MPLNASRLIELPRRIDARGALTFIEGAHHVPFEIRRVFYLYDVPTGSRRGGHAHRCAEEFLIALAGSFEVQLDTGRERRPFRLDRPNQGLYVAPMTWLDLSNFSVGCVCLVLTSRLYSESDYHRSYAEFLRETGTAS